MQFFACVLLAVAAIAGCGETAASAPPIDFGRDAAVDSDGGPEPDAAVDASVPPDGGADGDPDGGTSWCETSALCPACPQRDLLCDSDTPCPIGQACLPTGCGDLSRCFVTGGGGCQEDDDCDDPAYLCNQTIGRCLRIDPGCANSNDCVPGFACENASCVDRRAPCETGLDCPYGFLCFFASPDQRFCRWISRPCGDDLDCLTIGVPCGDVDGDGLRECMPSLTPLSPDPISCINAQCPGSVAPVCQPSVQGTGAVCGDFGLCVQTADCAAGFECRDLWGDGRSQCVLPGGSCVDSSGCAPRSVCGSPRPSGPPACVGSDAR